MRLLCLYRQILMYMRNFDACERFASTEIIEIVECVAEMMYVVGVLATVC